jgi:hypothetical protein
MDLVQGRSSGSVTIVEVIRSLQLTQQIWVRMIMVRCLVQIASIHDHDQRVIFAALHGFTCAFQANRQAIWSKEPNHFAVPWQPGS